jgi:hypothetical protein
MATTNFAKPINNIATTVAAPYTAGSGSLTVASAAGITLTAGQWVRVSTFRQGAPLSILKATAVAGNVLTIAGGIDGYTDVNLLVGDAAELRVTAGAFADMQTALNNLENGSNLPIFRASGSGHASGAVPDPGATAGTTRFLREDVTWAVPSGGGGGAVSSVFGRTGTVVAAAGDYGVAQVTGAAADNAVVHLAGAETITGAKTFAATINATGNLVTTSGTELVLAQTGDTYGASKLHLRNRAGANGALFENAGLDLVDFGFLTSTGTQNNIRMEHRVGSLADPNNSTGEFEYIFSPAVNFFTPLTIGKASVIVSAPLPGAAANTCNFAIGGTPIATTVRSSIFTGAAGNTGQVIQGSASQTAPLSKWVNSSQVQLVAVNADGSIALATLTDAAAANNALYFSSTTNKLSYKDPSGTIHAI